MFQFQLRSTTLRDKGSQKPLDGKIKIVSAVGRPLDIQRVASLLLLFHLLYLEAAYSAPGHNNGGKIYDC